MADYPTTRALLCITVLIARTLAVPTCTDRDDELREFAQNQDPPLNEITTCSELASKCDRLPNSVTELCCGTCPPPPQCTGDNHDGFVEWFKEQNPGVTVPSGCDDAVCASPRERDEFCCETCAGKDRKSVV